MDGQTEIWTLADELGYLRDEIKALREREATLRQSILDGAAAPQGMEYRVEVRRATARRFDRSALPDHIATDPAYWKTVPVVTVVTRPVSAGPDAADDLIEDI